MDDQEVLELMVANERMGAALSYVYRKYPQLRQEVIFYLADYPFEMGVSDAS